jgi:putative flippase GtrA
MRHLQYFTKKNSLYTIFLLPTNEPFIQFIRYIFVGGTAFITDAGTLIILHNMGIHYLVATAFAFIVGLTVNYSISKKTVFVTTTKNVGKIAEFAIHGAIGLAGLVLTEIIMFLITDILGVYFMISKVITATIVLFWNFIARKIILYM